VGARTWLKNMRLLCRHYTVYAPDLPGFGTSQPLNARVELSEFTKFVEDFRLVLGLNKFYLLGHSVGGGIALHYALEHPDRIEKLAVANSMCLGKEIAPWVRFFSIPIFCWTAGHSFVPLFRGIGWVMSKFFASLKYVNPLPRTKMELGNIVSSFQGQPIVLLDRLSALLVPTLVVWGARDGIVPVRQAYAAAQVIPDCQVRVFEDCGHGVYRQRVDDFSSLVTGFFR
jgi:pimeloyl-ACP methyl ester carboxylesterase